MPITGYTDKLSVMQGEKIKFMVNCDGHDHYEAQIVHLIHGDTDPNGPGFKVNKVDSSANGKYVGKKQEIHIGSYIQFEDNELFNQIKSFSLQAMIYPTTPNKGNQAILTKWSSKDNSGYGLFIDDNGAISIWIGNEDGTVEKVSTNTPLIKGAWYFVGGAFDADTKTVTVFQQSIVGKANGQFSLPYEMDKVDAIVHKDISIKPHSRNGAPFLIASSYNTNNGRRHIVTHKYNGKIDRPRVAKKAMKIEEMALWIETPKGNDLVAAWDFAEGVTKKGFENPEFVYDQSPNGLHGQTVNLPTRAMTGYN